MSLHKACTNLHRSATHTSKFARAVHASAVFHWKADIIFTVCDSRDLSDCPPRYNFGDKYYSPSFLNFFPILSDVESQVPTSSKFAWKGTENESKSFVRRNWKPTKLMNVFSFEMNQASVPSGTWEQTKVFRLDSSVQHHQVNPFGGKEDRTLGISIFESLLHICKSMYQADKKVAGTFLIPECH